MPVTASPVVSQPSADAAGVAQASGTAPADLQPVPQAIERLSKDGQALPRAAEKASADLARVPGSVIRTLPRELVPLEAYVEANLPIAKAMPLVDIVYGGGVLVVVVIVQAIGLRLLTGHVEKRAQTIGKRPALWRVDLLFGGSVFMLLGLHLGSVLLWSAAVVYGGVIPDWVQAARFAARSYTTIGSDHQVPEEWHMLGADHRHFGDVHLRLDGQRPGQHRRAVQPPAPPGVGRAPQEARGDEGPQADPRRQIERAGRQRRARVVWRAFGWPTRTDADAAYVLESSAACRVGRADQHRRAGEPRSVCRAVAASRVAAGVSEPAQRIML
jgi:hypothetical protein